MPTSNDTRVRVDGFSKIIATDIPARRSAYVRGDRFTWAERSRSRSSSDGWRSSIERKFLAMVRRCYRTVRPPGVESGARLGAAELGAEVCGQPGDDRLH